MSKILIVEDDPSTGELVKTLLKLSDHTIIHINDGTDAIQVVKDNKPDIILLDLLLPGKDGYSIQKELSKEKDLKNIPIVIMTVKPELEQIFTDAENVVGFLVKPFDVQSFNEIINSVIKK